jgi:hypothetical protein
MILLALMAVASASEAPVITLDLDESVLSNAQLCMYEDEWKDLVGGDLETNHFAGAPTHCGGHLLAKKCEVLSTAVTCPEPTAKGYSHEDGEIVDANGDSLVDREYVQNVESLPGQFPPTKAARSVANLNYNVRGETLIQYSVHDNSGNEADKIHFVMIMDDSAAPSLSSPHTPASFFVTYEAHFAANTLSNIYPLPALDAIVTDVYDGDVSTTRNVGETSSPCTGGETCSSNDDSAVTTEQLGTYLFDYTYSDYASVFGINHQNNMFTINVNVTVADTTAPKIFCDTTASSPETGTCTISADGASVECAGASETCAPQYLTCDDSHNYLQDAEQENFGAVAVDRGDDLNCAGATCTVTTSPLFRRPTPSTRPLAKLL